MRIIITGGLGYLGGRLGRFLLTQPNLGHEIVLGSREFTEAPHWLPQASTVQTNWNSQADLERVCSGAHAVIHLAGMNAKDCAANPVAALEMNGCATARLLHAAINQGVKRFIYLSTAHVYGSPLIGTITEDTCPLNMHAYATSHRAGEDVVRAAHLQGKIEGVVIRLSNAFGAPTASRANCWMLLVNDLVRQAVETQQMVLQTSGLQRRDFITLTDACRAISHLLELPRDQLGDGLFNASGEWDPTVGEMALLVAERMESLTGKRLGIIKKVAQAFEKSEMLHLKMAKLAQTGFRPSGSETVTMEIDGLIKFCLANPIT